MSADLHTKLQLQRARKCLGMEMLRNQALEYFIERPYAGLTILHNMHITESTLTKIASLASSGARVVVTSTSNMYSQQAVIDTLIREGFEFVPADKLYGFKCDVVLDCCASLVDVVKPRLGFVELTQTGGMIFKDRERVQSLEVPVISIDSSRVKQLETFLGTGESFVRAVKQLTNRDLIGAEVVLFGCGKVGSGVFVHLQSIHDIKVSVVESNKDRVEELLKLGVNVFHLADRKKWLPLLEGCDYIVTATGVKDMLSQHIDATDIKKSDCILANMGSEDEFGSNFPASMTLNNKKPINFALPEPTLSRFLDAVFVAHNQAIDYLLAEGVESKVFTLSGEQDQALIKSWLQLHFGVDNMEDLFARVLKVNPKYHMLFGEAK